MMRGIWKHELPVRIAVGLPGIWHALLWHCSCYVIGPRLTTVSTGPHAM